MYAVQVYTVQIVFFPSCIPMDEILVVGPLNYLLPEQNIEISELKGKRSGLISNA